MKLRSTDDVLDLLRDITQKADRGELPEGYGVFARTYHRMTLEMIVAIADNTFASPARMSAFVVEFADNYRRALEGPVGHRREGQRREEAPAALPWVRAFEVATREPTEPLHSLSTGVNAHMAYDLVITLVDHHGTAPELRADYDAINRVLARAIDPVQTVLAKRYGHWLRTLDTAGFKLDEILSLKIFEHVRDRAWQDAVDIDAGRLTREQVAERVARSPLIG